MAKKSPLLGIVSALAGPVIGLFNKKKRDEETPRGAGRLRDAGAVLGAAGAASAVATQTGHLPWNEMGLDPAQAAWLNAITCAVGALMYLTGIGKSVKDKPDTEITNEISKK